jgi:DNA recombination-dependent growth factor C
MGLLSNSGTFVRFAVEGEMAENFWEFAAERIASHAFKDIDDNYEEYSIGWVSVMNMFDSQFAYASHAVGDYIVLSMRIDERKVPSSVLKKYCLKEEERVRKEKQVPKLSRGNRLEIKENITLLLTKKAAPIPAVYDLCWNLANNTVLFFSTSANVHMALEDLFKETFDLHLVQQVPYLAAAHLLNPAQEVELAAMSSSILI